MRIDLKDSLVERIDPARSGLAGSPPSKDGPFGAGRMPDGLPFSALSKHLSPLRRQHFDILCGVLDAMTALANDTACSKKVRTRRLDDLTRRLLQPTGPDAATGNAGRSAGHRLAKIAPAFHGVLYRYGISRGSFLEFARRLGARNSWPDGPHFVNFEALDRYNENLARSVAECLSHILFLNISGPARRRCKLAFKDLAKAMQLVALLVDVDGATLRGHYFLPQEAYRSDRRLLVRQVCVRLLIDAHQCAERARGGLQDEALEPDVRDFLMASQDVYQDLRRSCLMLARYGPGPASAGGMRTD